MSKNKRLDLDKIEPLINKSRSLDFDEQQHLIFSMIASMNIKELRGILGDVLFNLVEGHSLNADELKNMCEKEIHDINLTLSNELEVRLVRTQKQLSEEDKEMKKTVEWFTQ
jgi:hypothetical protein|tara:strand:- start:1647 stop:1982 length:336 start_codon:yes stop_codon:yes gene_type:complete